MRLSDFSYQLPLELIARYPLEERSACRLLSLDGTSGKIELGSFTDISKNLNPGDLLIFNDTRVIAARLYGRKITGGKIEVLIERILDSNRALAHIKASRAPNIDSVLYFDSSDGSLISANVLSRQGSLFELLFSERVLIVLDKIGHIPLPPYIGRADDELDRRLYQTVYNKRPGAVAAPTAGLHFDEALIDNLQRRGIESGFVTLHIGAGTFQPVRVSSIHHHQMHAEYAEVPTALVEKVIRCKERGNRVVAVGTSSVRALESAAQDGGVIKPFCADTKIFIFPGFQFNIVDVLITNFHLPESTLLMLVSAFAGHQNVMNAYKIALEQRFRFFSYGDAMWISKKPTI